jgi:hypothetical protein
MKTLNSVAFLLLFVGVAMGCSTAYKELMVEPLDISHGTKWARPVEERQVTGPSIQEAIIKTGGDVDETMEY